jgi:hypothetical protein
MVKETEPFIVAVAEERIEVVDMHFYHSHSMKWRELSSDQNDSISHDIPFLPISWNNLAPLYCHCCVSIQMFCLLASFSSLE